METKIVIFVVLLLTSSVEFTHAGRNDDDCGLFCYVVGGAAAGVLTVVAAPVVLGAAGFTAAGVAAGSLAAGFQTATTVAGSAFAVSQSVGAAGLALGTKAALVGAGAATGGAVHGYKKKCSDC